MFSVGMASGYVLQSTLNKTLTILSAERKMNLLDDWISEIGAGISLQQIATLYAGRSWKFAHDEDTLTPFVSVRVVNYIDSSEFLAGLVNFNRFKIQGHYGIDDIELWNENFQMDIGLGFGASGVVYTGQLGWKF